MSFSTKARQTGSVHVARTGGETLDINETSWYEITVAAIAGQIRSTRRIHRALIPAMEALVVAGAFATIPLTVLLERHDVPGWVRGADWTIWLVFLVEYWVMIFASPARWHYIRTHPINAAVVLLSFPSLPTVLGLVRVIRLLRFLRLLRLVGVTTRAISGLGDVFGRSGFLYVASVSLFILVAGGAALAVLEPQTVHGGFFDGIWWAVVTATTVGYGDIAPATLWGRLIAVALMLTGVGLISTLAASITAHFLAEDKTSGLQQLSDRIARLEALLQQTAHHPSSGPTSQHPH